jgi:hypothetical protein
MAAATAVEATVKSAGTLALTCAAACVAALLGAASAQAATQVLVVAGIGGEAQYEERFTQWSQTMAGAALTATGDKESVVRLAGEGATRDAITRELARVARSLAAGDQFMLLLVGHGSFDGNEYRLNLPGPDMTGSDLLALLDKLPAGVPQLVVNGTSTSGAIADKWARPNRVVITATKSGGERNATRFAGFWAEAMTSEAADRDKDGAVTAQEAYDFATRKVADAYKADAALLTEHAKLTGSDPGRFVLARLGTAALFASDPELIALRRQQGGIEGRLAELKPLKTQLPRDDYYNRIEPVLLELAKLGEKVDARLAALGVKAPTATGAQGGGNAAR